MSRKKVPIWVKGLEDKRILDHYEWHEVAADHQFHAATYEMLARMAPHGLATPSVGLVSTRRGRSAQEHRDAEWQRGFRVTKRQG